MPYDRDTHRLRAALAASVLVLLMGAVFVILVGQLVEIEFGRSAMYLLALAGLWVLIEGCTRNNWQVLCRLFRSARHRLFPPPKRKAVYKLKRQPARDPAEETS